MKPKLIVMLVGVAVGAIGGAYAARRRESPPVAAPTPTAHTVRELRVPKLTGSITLDGEMDDPGWRRVGRTGTFLGADGQPSRPYSEARFAWGDGMLYVMLYAADEDIRSDGDSFHLDLGGHPFDVSPLGKVAQGGVESAHDLDGTLDHDEDDDEEWVIELAIPLSLLGAEAKSGTTVSFSAHRCDTPHRSERTCGQWGETSPTVLLFE